jgi:hypothetical protein
MSAHNLLTLAERYRLAREAYRAEMDKRSGPASLATKEEVAAREAMQDAGDNAGGWFWIRGPQGGDGHRGDIGATETDALAAAWAHHKAEHDPPGMQVFVWPKEKASDPPTAWCVALRGKVHFAAFEGAEGETTARAAAWAWHDRRRAIAIDIYARTCGGKALAVLMSAAITWTDAECAEVEAYAALPFPCSVDMPAPPRGPPWRDTPRQGFDMTQDAAWLDYTKPPPGYRIDEQDGEFDWYLGDDACLSASASVVMTLALPLSGETSSPRYQSNSPSCSSIRYPGGGFV